MGMLNAMICIIGVIAILWADYRGTIKYTNRDLYHNLRRRKLKHSK